MAPVPPPTQGTDAIFPSSLSLAFTSHDHPSLPCLKLAHCRAVAPVFSYETMQAVSQALQR